MTLVDSNIIIYSYSTQYEYLRSLILNDMIFISEISEVEVLGYHQITSDEESYFRKIFDLVTIIIPSREVFEAAIEIRRKHRLTLGDSIIAATAVMHGLSLYTRNLKDFEKIADLNCINPIK
ncbi:type II toxin-antitoxin system VapC family toxin [Mucilaginibacter gotjawali]|uniref:tRNA(FMet)-specific endonuclease VapC n=2 Tax=Mucilaginibacter gotjawali TaxID=1550579 RepID=A0A0X8X3T0_9SPHI|nr:type II toxin-antitoxin system VapC family toxin [Mucilaginibacter gotjawali]BAU55169.1 tRNA(fMet)-specific endonuclease VapC [Mucilaginibacter gotjawali]